MSQLIKISVKIWKKKWVRKVWNCRIAWLGQTKTKGAYFALIFLLEKCVTFCNIFINSYFVYFWFKTVFITDYVELLISLDQTVPQLSKTLRLKMSSRSKINCGHCGQLNTVEYALINHQTDENTLSNHWTVGFTL